MGQKPIEPWGTSPEKRKQDEEEVARIQKMELGVEFDGPIGALRVIAEEMEQWERLSFVDSTGNRVYVTIDYYGDGYEYDDLENRGTPIKSPGNPNSNFDWAALAKLRKESK